MKRRKISAILVACVLLSSGCADKKSRPTATIQQLYSEITIDESGSEKVIVDVDTRTVTKAHPELTAYNSNTKYGAVYLPAFDQCLDSEHFSVIYSDAVNTVLKDDDNPTASYIISSIRTYTVPSDDYEACTDITPYMVIPYNDNTVPILLPQVRESQQDQIKGKLGTGFTFDMICGSNYVPSYAYGVFTYEKREITSHVNEAQVNCVMMITDNIVTNNESDRKIGEPQEPIVVDSRTNKGSKTLSSVLGEKLPVTYSAYIGKTSIAVPSFMTVQEDRTGIEVLPKNDDHTPLDYCGMSVVYGESATIEEACDMMKEKASKAFGYEKPMNNIPISDIHYEEGLTFMGSDEAAHIYGMCMPEQRTVDEAQKLPGNGFIMFDIYTFNKGGTDYIVMFYYGEEQEDEVNKWIGLNIY